MEKEVVSLYNCDWAVYPSGDIFLYSAHGTDPVNGFWVFVDFISPRARKRIKKAAYKAASSRVAGLGGHPQVTTL